MPKPINISASRGAAILGLSSWSTSLNVWLEIMESRVPGFCGKNLYFLPEFDEDPALLRWGHAFESAIIELAEEKYGQPIINRERFFAKNMAGELYFGPSQHYVTCHIDGQQASSADGTPYILHEGKTTSAFYFRDNFGEPGTDRVPVEYQIQCQHQMICTGAEKVILSVLVFPRRVEEWEEMGYIPKKMINGKYRFSGENKYISITDWSFILAQMGYFHQYEIPAHEKLQTLMIKHYKQFWNKNILEGIMPQPKTYDDIKAICREPVGTFVATEEMERFMSEYKNIKSEISGTGALAKRADQIKVAVLEYMRLHGADAVDDDSQEKYILRDRAGRKIASYGKNKNGNFYFR